MIYFYWANTRINLTCPEYVDAKSKITPIHYYHDYSSVGARFRWSTIPLFVGIIFDGNIQSLALDVAYSDKQAHPVSVDSAAITEALRKVYDANALADDVNGRAPSRVILSENPGLACKGGSRLT